MARSAFLILLSIILKICVISATPVTFSVDNSLPQDVPNGIFSSINAAWDFIAAQPGEYAINLAAQNHTIHPNARWNFTTSVLSHVSNSGRATVIAGTVALSATHFSTSKTLTASGGTLRVGTGALSFTGIDFVVPNLTELSFLAFNGTITLDAVTVRGTVPLVSTGRCALLAVTVGSSASLVVKNSNFQHLSMLFVAYTSANMTLDKVNVTRSSYRRRSAESLTGIVSAYRANTVILNDVIFESNTEGKLNPDNGPAGGSLVVVRDCLQTSVRDFRLFGSEFVFSAVVLDGGMYNLTRLHMKGNGKGKSAFGTTIMQLASIRPVRLSKVGIETAQLVDSFFQPFCLRAGYRCYHYYRQYLSLAV
ncbi:hypothetical protein DFS34DRAFT_75819 [Phlyctochytrium arcticum]|nr:hypothetical protein DFS34DRAFT_75819 [Phlyctochytrium arcticum]